MFEDKLTRALVKRSEEPKESVPLPVKQPFNSEEVALRRKANAFRAQGNALIQQAAIQDSHKRKAQLQREADVALGLADQYEQQADSIVKHIGIDGVKLGVAVGSLRENEIAHYGRKGMKWGQRIFSKKKSSSSKKGSSSKKSSSDSSEAKATKTKASKDSSKKVSEKDAKKTARKMTDDELSAHIKRLDMEQRYTKLATTPKTKTRMDAGKRHVQDVLVNSSKKAASKHATKLMFDGMTYAIQKQRPDYQPKWKS